MAPSDGGAKFELLENSGHLGLPLFFVLPVAIYFLAWVVYTQLFHPLSRIPGPFWGSVSRLWQVYHISSGRIEYVQRELHKRYGPVVRIAPDEVLCSDPEAIKTVYPSQSPPVKTNFYPPWGYPGISKYADLFSETNEQLHSQRRRIVNNVFSLSTVLSLEEYINKCSELLIRRMGEYADNQSVMDIGEWVQWYAFDVIGELFFGRMFGFMEGACDHGNYIEALDSFLPFITTMTMTPKPYQGLFKLWAMFSPSSRKAMQTMPKIAEVAKTCVADRIQLEKEQGSVRSDLLQKFLTILQTKGGQVDFGMGEVELLSLTALFAGSDTTAIAMRACFYYLLKNPAAYAELQKELDEAAETGQISKPVKFSEASRLPLLCATIKEALRMHPAVGLQLPRVSPAGGLVVAGRFIPAGYRVGMNAAVLGYDEATYGSDASEFRPNRWLESEKGDQIQASKMDRNSLVFGAGTRTCIGKNISLAEIHKLVPLVLLNFHLEPVDPHKTWQTQNFWFNKQIGIRVRVTRRS
ncbi:hypothetical protein CLAIMM_11473 [Cladophialophora immunda]|nr:hypothetical protein CLAIMM_11473 [Cladophialophora immunda]